MNIFGWDLSLKRLRSRKKNSLISSFLAPWQYNKPLYNDEDFHLMVNQYKGWIYLCAGSSLPLAQLY